MRLMKKILMLHFRDLSNYGTAMMGLISTHGLLSLSDKIEILEIDLSNDEQLNAILKELSSDALYPKNRIKRAHIPKKSRYFKTIRLPRIICSALRKLHWKINKLFGWNVRFIDEPLEEYIRTNQFDAVYFLGGDDFSEYYSGNNRLWELGQLYHISKITNVILLGQSPGPFEQKINKKDFSRLGSCYFFVREKSAVEYLSRDFNFCKNVSLMGDLAFLPLPLQRYHSKESNILKKYNLAPNGFITIVTSGHPYFYSTNNRDFVRAWSKIIKKLLSHPSFETKSICLLPHTRKGIHGSEINFLFQIKELLTDSEKKRINIIPEHIGPTIARWVLGNGYFTISCRMHACVSSYQMEKPAIALSYSRKYYGVLDEGLGRSDLIVNAKGEELWSKEEIVNSVWEKILYLEKNYDAIVKEIPLAVSKEAEKALNAIKSSISIWQ